MVVTCFACAILIAVWTFTQWRNAHRRRMSYDLTFMFIGAYCREVGRMPSSWDDLRRHAPHAMNIMDSAAEIIEVQWEEVARLECDIDQSNLDGLIRHRWPGE